MPNILVRLPENTLSAQAKSELVAGLNAAAAAAEQIPDDPQRRLLCWVLIEEVGAGDWTCGGHDVTDRFIPVLVQVLLPQGVLDDAARLLYVAEVEAAVHRALPAGEARRPLTSVVLQEVPDGFWGVSGRIWRLPEFAARAGFAHLQHLVG